MLAYVYEGKGNLVLKEMPGPELKEDNAIFKVEACSICGTDFRTYTYGNERITSPRIIGHEVTGTLIEVGSSLEGFKVGDRVNVAPAIGCGECYECKEGHPNLCSKLETIGFQYNGGFAEYMEIPLKAFQMGNVIKINKPLDIEEATVAEPIACCVNAQGYLNINQGDSVVIFGAGFIGCIHAELALSKGAAEVIIVELEDSRVSQAEELLDNIVVLNPLKEDLQQRIAELTDGRGADVTITACSSGKAQESALEIAAKRARISLFGGLPGVSKGFIDSNLIHYKELSVFGVHASTPEQNREVIEMIANRALNVKKYISVFTLTEIEKAFEAIKEGRVIKVVIKPEEGK